MIKIALVVIGIITIVYISLTFKLMSSLESFQQEQRDINTNQIEIDKMLVEGMYLLTNKCIK